MRDRACVTVLYVSSTVNDSDMRYHQTPLFSSFTCLGRHEHEGGLVSSLDEIAHQPMAFDQRLALVRSRPPLVKRSVGIVFK